MRWRPLFWLGLSVLFFVAAAYFWQLGDKWEARKAKAGPAATPQTTSPTNHAAAGKAPKLTGQSPAATTQSASGAGVVSSLDTRHPTSNTRFAYRLSNTKKSLGELTRDDKAILLENALVDTSGSKDLGIPSHLKAEGDPGSYIVQSKGPLDDTFRAMLAKAGATIVSYIPNNAYLVRASADVASGLGAVDQVQAVLPYEPYYKLKSSLLKLAIEQQPLPSDGNMLNLLLFPDKQDATLDELDALGVEIVGKERSPFGTQLKVRAPKDGWVDVARLPGVEVMEMARPRARANDLSRANLGVASDSRTPANFLNLTGQGVLVNINDTGVDASHPDLSSRVIGDLAGSLTDTDGHGTHVAGIIASSGAQSSTVTNASGSVMPGVTGQFRGIAPSAKLFSISTDLTFGPGSDTYLQETAARTNALISNNSWHYFNDTEYDLAAASYDAAVRDALPGASGSQPVLYVFSAGNDGGGTAAGTGGSADSIGSPGTAKNVITVGAIEQFRTITNETWICRDTDTGTNVMNICFTNKPWVQVTDSSNQVAAFSSRGNVGVGTEGDFGRFKPDLVAPGTFVVSTKSQQWDQAAYYNPTNYHFDFVADQIVGTNDLEPYAIFVPGNAVQLNISVFAPEDLRIYVKQSGVPTRTSYDVLGTNTVSLPPGKTLSPVDTFWNYAIESIQKDKIVPFSILTELVTTNDQGNYLEVLSNLNNTLGPYYRYESGTSMSAGGISGMLALMQEFFQRASPSVTNSPALMKALLINGARPTSDQYDLQVQNSINYQGWGVANLATSIPTNALGGGTGSKLFFDQSPTNALASGQSRTFSVTVKPEASGAPFRVTLAWTDPPGNPVASVKLVNDLDLIVTNRDTGEVFHGNDILAGSDFNSPWDTNTLPHLDVVNNVENVYLLPPLGGTYDVTVVGRRVNVNAVTAHPNDVVQDFALVISSGDGEVSDALAMAGSPTGAPAPGVLPVVTYFTNSFSQDPENFGGVILEQHVGANPVLLGTNTIPWPPVNGQITIGTTIGWHFYVFTNTTSFTNAAFLTFLPPTLSEPRIGVRESDPNNATRFEADIDLYVTTDFSITNLNAAAIAAAQKSLGRGGTETVVLSNATPGVYYIGVKSEDQEGAEFGFVGVFSLNPFANQDENGNLLLRGFPNFAAIPDGSPEHPGGTRIFAVAPQPITIRRAVVTNNITHELVSDLFGRMDHGRDFVVLNNHSGQGGVTNVSFIYNDSNQHDIPNSQHTDGPGSLLNFGGKQGAGQWMLTMVDNAPGHVGTNNVFTVWLEKQKDLLEGETITLANNECSEDFIFVPPEATNLTVTATITAGATPVTMDVCPVNASGPACQEVQLGGPGSTNTVVINKSSHPPLNPGFYVVRICNTSGGDVTVRVQARLEFDLNGINPSRYSSTIPIAIPDDAVTNSSIFVTNDDKIVSLEVGVRIDHPRVSDLVLHLISPDGTRILLDENRGATTPNGMGFNLFHTNILPVTSTGDWQAQTNVFDTGQTSGSITIDWDFFDIADWMRVYYDGNLIMDTGVYKNAGSTNLAYGPGNSTTVTIVMNEGGNTNAQGKTAWEYTVGTTLAQYVYTTFTENTNETVTPMKFAIPPFTVPNYLGTNTALTNQIFYLPEDSDGLAQLVNTSSQGEWKLELWDDRVGAANPQPVLLSWQLSFVFATQEAVPEPLVHDTPVINTLPAGQIQYFSVAVPYWASFATNTLLSTVPSQGLNVMFNQFSPPSGTNIGSGDFMLMTGATGPQFVTLDTNGVPPLPLLRPGFKYYIGVSNPGPAAVTFEYQVDFNVTPLTNGIPVASPADFNSVPRYFSYDVTSNETVVSFALTNLDGNVNLVARKGLPFPAPTNYALGSFNPSTDDEDIIVFANSEGIALSPGRWYLGVFNADTVDVNYTIVVTDSTNTLPPIITLFNMIPYANTNSGVGSTNDYYRYLVTTNAVRAQFEINNASADMTLVARKGLPLPDLSSFDLISANPGTTDELIVLYDWSRPVALTPGEWFLTAINVSGAPATYSIKASEWPLYGTNIVITNSGISGGNSFCITWTSLPGVHYYVQGRRNLMDPTWDVVSPTITATDYSTTWCLPLPSQYHFFRVHEGLSALATPTAGPPAISGISRNGSGVTIRWTAGATNQFRVQWANSVVAPSWNTLSTIVTSANGNFTFTDDGSQTGGLGTQRYYRLQQLP
jgi:subtilisin family serine protease/subtilisin-like proprotein convertase family protein